MKKDACLHLDIRSDIREFEDALSGIPKGMEKASVRAINRTLANLRAEGVRIATQTYTAKARTIRSGISIFRASGKHPAGRITFAGSDAIPLYSFRVKPKHENWKGIPVRRRKPWEGVSAMIRRDGKFRVRYEDGMKTFIATTRKGMTGVFYRNSKSSPAKIAMSFGPGPIVALMKEENRKRMDKRANEQFRKNLAHEVDVLLKGIAR